MKILGIDPGLAATGWAIVEKAKTPLLGDYGCITTAKTASFASRLDAIFRKSQAIIRQYRPDILAIEELFFAKNSKTAINVAQAMGVVKLAGQQANIPVIGYTPLHIKIAIVGYGRADKHQVEFMVKKILHRRESIKPNHAADAVAVALTHLFQNPQLK